MSVQELLLLTLLKKLEEKYGEYSLVKLEIFSDGSGLISQREVELLHFRNVDELLKHLS